MRKLMLIIFALGFISANATAIAPDCHAQACAEVEAWENEFPDATVGELEAVYYMAYNECNMQ
jgi:hypothetical protein